MREELARELNTKALEGDGLQGALIHCLALRLADPDLPVRQWLLDEAAPLGIDRRIEPGGVFPAAAPQGEDDEDEDWRYSADNYQSYEGHREGAEALLKSARRAGCRGI